MPQSPSHSDGSHDGRDSEFPPQMRPEAAIPWRREPRDSFDADRCFGEHPDIIADDGGLCDPCRGGDIDCFCKASASTFARDGRPQFNDSLYHASSARLIRHADADADLLQSPVHDKMSRTGSHDSKSPSLTPLDTVALFDKLECRRLENHHARDRQVETPSNPVAIASDIDQPPDSVRRLLYITDPQVLTPSFTWSGQEKVDIARFEVDLPSRWLPLEKHAGCWKTRGQPSRANVQAEHGGLRLVKWALYISACAGAFVMYRFGSYGFRHSSLTCIICSSPLDQPSLQFPTDSTRLTNLLAQPSLTTTLVAIAVYSAAMGCQYYHQRHHRRQDLCLFCGVALGIVVGCLLRLDANGIIFQILPGFALTAMLVSAYTSS